MTTFERVGFIGLGGMGRGLVKNLVAKGVAVTAYDLNPAAVAVAKSCAGHAASTVVRNAHQVHGAIGTTFEHELHWYTKPILAWRSEFGSVALWDRLLTQAAVGAGRDDAWALITGGKPLPGLLDALV